MSFRVPYRPTISFSKFIIQRGPVIVFLIICLAYLLQDGSVSSLFGFSSEDAIFENRICMDSLTKKPIATVSKYAILIDVGSTGTRLHVYEFEYCSGKLFSLASELFKEIPIGVATLSHNLSAIEALIFHSLLTYAMGGVPSTHLSCTPIAVKATAGLRLLASDKVTLILDAIRDLLKKYPFRLAGTVESDAVSVISGQEEGVWGWITVNFLLHKIGHYRKHTSEVTGTAATMDLGGASTQIVFEIDQKDVTYYERNVPGSLYFYSLHFGDKNYTLFQHSFLGYGLMEARKRANRLFIAESLKSGKDAGLNQSFCCLPSSYTERVFDSSLLVNANATDYDWLNGSDVTLNALQCRRWMTSIFEFDTLCSLPPCSFAGVPHPQSFKFLADIYGFSYIYDRTQPFLSQGSSSTLTPDSLWQMTESMCTAKNTSGHALYSQAIKENPFYCMDLVYIHTLLSAAYGIQPTRKVNIVKKINGFETAWTLGAAIDLLDRFQGCASN